MKPQIKNIAELFLNASEQHPENIAIIFKNEQIAYSQLHKDVLSTASYFKEMGIKQGDRILVFVPMSIDLYRIVLATFYLGATAVFLDEWVSMKRLELCCNLADCKGFIGTKKARLFSFFSRELRKIPIKLSVRKMSEDKVPIAHVDHDSTALITFTTGSTGTPKAANRTHAFLHEQFNALLVEIQPSPSDVDMPVLPIVLFINLGVGCTSVIADFNSRKPKTLNEEKIVTQLLGNNVNRLIASPFFVKKMSQYVLKNKVNLPLLEKVFTGGAPVFPSEAALYNSAFPEATSMIVYGSTEAEPISSIQSTELVGRNDEMKSGLPVGKPVPIVDLRIIGIHEGPLGPFTTEELDKVVLEDGKIGEIIVAGKHVLKQYFNNEEAYRENKINIEGEIWHRTGDSGFLKGKELFLTGRCTQLIPTDQTYLSPFIIENQLQEIEGISIGTLMEYREKKFLILESNLQKDSIEQELDGIRYDEIVIVKTIPRDPRHHSKIDYPKLKSIVF